jgi:hypothetical protein
MKLELSNVVLRAYKKKNERIALHLRSHLLVFDKVPFSFTGYMKKMESWITLPGQKELKADDMTISVACTYSENIMIHSLHSTFILPYQELENSIANLRMMFNVSFTGYLPCKDMYDSMEIVEPFQNT